MARLPSSNLFTDYNKIERRKKVDYTIEVIHRKFGKNAVFPVELMGDLKMPNHRTHEITVLAE